MRRSVGQNKKSGIDVPISRRSLLIGGGATAGLLVAWAAWPRSYRANLAVGSNETLINAFLKIDNAGQIIVVVPQLEMGQGITTVLPQILADELGADWRTVAVQGAPVSPLYANVLLAKEFLANDWSRLAGGAGDWVLEQIATREAMMLTGGATAVRQFSQSYRDAGAAARVLLCKAAAARWDVAWESCTIVDGLVTDGQRQLKIGELAAEAARFTLPDILPERDPAGEDARLLGQDVPRLDLPSKVDGSHNYAADIRLPDMVFASIRQGPPQTVALTSCKDAEAAKVTGFLQLVKRDHWVAAVATNWWAANKALDLIDPEFEVAGPLLDDQGIARTLDAALQNGDGNGERLYSTGNLEESFAGKKVLRAEYSVAPALHLAMEPPSATARVTDIIAEIWVASQAPTFCRAAIAGALGMDEEQVVLYPISAGGSFDRRMDHDVAVQAALIAQELKRPVQLLWSRAEDIITDRPRPPARARMTARLISGGMIEGLSAKVAAPVADAETWARIAHNVAPMQAAKDASTRADARAIAGMVPPYSIPNIAVDHYPVDIGLPTGRWRGNADSYSCFFVESFIDELAEKAGVEPLSFRIQHLGQQARLAHCLSTAAAMGGWQGGIPGSGQGIACHIMDGGCIAIIVEAGFEGNSIRVKSALAVADVGDQPHPDIARQQIEGGILFGLAAAMGGAAQYRKGMPTRAIMGRLGLPRLSNIGEVRVELVPSKAEPSGVEQIGVAPIAPAVASALHTITGRRLRSLPLLNPK